jgi:16S rRNA (uracil1498-N3)-methyltransferase
LLKGEKFDLVIQKATELGVTRIIPLITSRADVRIKSADDAERKMARWQRIVLEATKQCGRARLMKIQTPMMFADLICGGQASDSGEKTASEDACASVKDIVMFAERGGTSFTDVLSYDQVLPENVMALIGPEGGWSDEEIKQAGVAGCKIVTLGGRMLRAETAAIVVASLMQHRFGDLQ